MIKKVINKQSFIFIMREAEDDIHSVKEFFEYMERKEKHVIMKMLSVSKVWETMTVEQQLTFANTIVDQYNISRFLALMDYLSKTEGKSREKHT